MRACVRVQRGVALPIVIILMVILGLIALSGMDDTALQERMAGNLRDREIAFQAAESALRAGEAWLQTNAASVAGNTPLPGIEAATWDGAVPAPSGSLTGLYDAADAISLVANPVYYAGPPSFLRINPGEIPPKFRTLYPVIARSHGATDSTLVILRSVIEPL